jgi:hypothetical protein
MRYTDSEAVGANGAQLLECGLGKTALPQMLHQTGQQGAGLGHAAGLGAGLHGFSRRR